MSKQPTQSDSLREQIDAILLNDAYLGHTWQLRKIMQAVEAHYAAKGQEAVLRARLEETESTYQTLQEYLIEDMDSDEITTQLQEDLRQYRSDLTNQLNQMKGEK